LASKAAIPYFQQGPNYCKQKLDRLRTNLRGLQGFHRPFVRPTHTTMPQLVLYTRQGCHLCDDALALLRRHGFEPRLVDIDSDPVLRERYNECVPVVEIDGKERFRGRINEVLLARLLSAK
jgi:glutaredoxin